MDKAVKVFFNRRFALQLTIPFKEINLEILFPSTAMPLMSATANTYHRNSLEQFLDERRLSNFHFLLPFLSGLGFNSSHLSKGEAMLTEDNSRHRIRQTQPLKYMFQYKR